MTIGSKRVAIDEDEGDRVDGLIFGQTEKLARNGRRRELDQDDVIQTDSVERIEESHSSLKRLARSAFEAKQGTQRTERTNLYLVSHDHGVKDILYSKGSLSSPRQIGSETEDGAEVIAKLNASKGNCSASPLNFWNPTSETLPRVSPLFSEPAVVEVKPSNLVREIASGVS
jgi:hypothetical protein